MITPRSSVAKRRERLRIMVCNSPYAAHIIQYADPSHGRRGEPLHQTGVSQAEAQSR